MSLLRLKSFFIILTIIAGLVVTVYLITSSVFNVSNVGDIKDSSSASQSAATSKYYAALKRTGDRTWGWLYPTVPANNLYTIACPAANSCYAGGANGTILFSSNEGKSWSSQISNVADEIREIDCPSAKDCYALTNSSEFLATNNGGVDWDVSTVNTKTARLDCPSPKTCFTSSSRGQISLTQDAGKTWQIQTDSLTGTNNYSFMSLSCPTSTTCWVVGADKNYDMSREASPIFVSHDSGKTWQRQIPPSVLPLFDIFCLDTTTCWAVGWRSLILNTADGGVTWKIQKPQLISSPIGLHLAKITCFSQTQCFAIGGISVFSTLNGKDWQEQKPPAKKLTEFRDISCANLNTCIVAGEITPLLITSDRGKSWTGGLAPVITDLAEIVCPDAKTCYASSRHGKLLTTKDGGITWLLNQSTLGSEIFEPKMACPSISNCYIIEQKNELAVTNDGGDTWNNLSYATAGELDEEMSGIACPGKSVCYLYGENGLILNSVNSGKTWTKQATNTNLPILKISCANPLVCVAIGATENKGFTATSTAPAEGIILATTDGGQNWKTSSKSAELIFNNISCPSTTTCFALQKLFGDTQSAPLAVMRTTNGSQSWEKVGQIKSSGIITCPNTTACYIASEDGVVSITNDGGKTWITQNPGAEPGLLSISCPNSKLCYLISSSNNGQSSSILVSLVL